jgi:hypothetical protein
VGVVCASISSWQDELVSGASDLQAATTPEEAQQLVGDYLKEVVDATDVMVDEVAGAGVPDVDQGEAIAEDFQTALGSLRDSFQEARAEVESLSADDPITLGQQLEDVGASLQDAGLEAGQAFDQLAQDYPNAGIDEAAANEPACAAITS